MANKKPLIDQWHHAARCRRETSQWKAHKLWSLLKPFLLDKDRTQLSIAWSHAIMAEQSPKELDTLVKKIKESLCRFCGTSKDNGRAGFFCSECDA